MEGTPRPIHPIGSSAGRACLHFASAEKLADMQKHIKSDTIPCPYLIVRLLGQAPDGVEGEYKAEVLDKCYSTATSNGEGGFEVGANCWIETRQCILPTAH